MSSLIQRSAQVASVGDFIGKNRDKLEKLIPKHIDGERMLSAAMAVIMGDKRLAQCEAPSLLNSVIQAAVCGVEINTPLQHAYLVAYGRTCQLQIGYRGLIHLARQSGEVSQVYAHAVHDGDHFELELGTAPKLEHKPDLTANRGEAIGYYAVIIYRDGAQDFEYMNRQEVDGIRNRSKAGNNGPWQTDYDEMARKTVLRRLLKRAPLTTAAARAQTVDNASAMGERLRVRDLVPDADIDVPEDMPDDSPMATAMAADPDDVEQPEFKGGAE